MKEVKPINILKAKNREELRLWLENNYETQKENPEISQLMDAVKQSRMYRL